MMAPGAMLRRSYRCSVSVSYTHLARIALRHIGRVADGSNAVPVHTDSNNVELHIANMLFECCANFLTCDEKL